MKATELFKNKTDRNIIKETCKKVNGRVTEVTDDKGNIIFESADSLRNKLTNDYHYGKLHTDKNNDKERKVSYE